MNGSGSILQKSCRCLTAAMLCMVFFGVWLSPALQAQSNDSDNQENPSPRGAFVRSLVMPGWGHYYADRNNWNRGKYHLAGEAVLLLSYFGMDARAGYLENDFRTLARSKAGTDLNGRPRDYLIAIGNYDDLAAYNDAQLQSRNWDQVYPSTPEYQWSWESQDYRLQYQDTRSRVDRLEGQLPTLVAFMVINRFISGISAFIQARDHVAQIPEAQVTYAGTSSQKGFKATIRFRF